MPDHPTLSETDFTYRRRIAHPTMNEPSEMPTPLTDAETSRIFQQRKSGNAKLAELSDVARNMERQRNHAIDFARQLERDLSTLRKENEKLLADKRAAERRAAIWMSMIHGLPAEINERFHDAAKQFDERAALASLRSELAKTTPTTPETPAPHPG